MTPAFELAFIKTLVSEGGYGNDPDDSGGPTTWGITEREARANGYTGPMKALTVENAKQIYCKQYWDLLNLDRIAEISQKVAEEVFDTAVNCGQGISGKFLQRALNVLNREERDYQDVREDGLVGPLTVQALRAFMQKREADGGEVVLLRALNCLQGARYVEIASTRKKDETFTFGWFKNRIGI
jgi:lysozyme family protein